MSYITSIHIYNCDDCAAITVIKNRTERESFEQLWLSRHGLDFCPKCRNKVSTQIEIREAAAPDRVAARMVKKYRREIGCSLVPPRL